MQTRDNKITNKLVKQGKLPKSQMEIYPQKSGLTRDNKITNKLVKQGKLPKSQMEIHPQKFSPQQIRSIKRSPKGSLPKFLNNYA